MTSRTWLDACQEVQNGHVRALSESGIDAGAATADAVSVARFSPALLVIIACLGLCAAALASRARTPTERAAIVAALPADLRDTPPGCFRLDIHVSRNGRYALVTDTLPHGEHLGSRCTAYGRNGFDILRKRARRWRIVYEGSVDPSCSLRIPRDLIGCQEPDTEVDVRSGATIASFETANDPTLAGAIKALGVPSSCSVVPGLRSFASVRWRRLRLRMVFATYGYLPKGGPCAAPRRVVLDSAFATGRE